MSHTTIILSSSLLEVFDTANPEYAGLQDHYTPEQWSKLQELRTRPAPASFTFEERIFICWALDKAVMTAENP